MLNKVIGKVFGTSNDRELKRLQPLVAEINAQEPSIKALSDAQLIAKTAEFRQRIDQGAEVDDLLVEAFAVVREAGWRVLNMRHFDVQLIGGIVLHQGRIAEMRTGEGKTLMATLPAYLNGVTGRGVHVVTVNDYLARRDMEWMGQIYRFLGLSTGVIQHDIDENVRREAYQADITYGTNNEIGFDYLRDNMKFHRAGMVQQKGHNFAIIDEVDSILIDEARTPLIISGPSEGDTRIYYEVDRIIPRLKAGASVAGETEREKREELEETGDYIVDIKSRNVVLTEQGVAHAERLLGVGNLYDPSNIEALHAVNQGLRAHTLYRRDTEYLIENGEVIIIDEFTGRKMPGRRWSDGLHQAVEAKEGVEIRSENQTLATITFQNLFRMYDKLSGMTGTAETEAAEFHQIYKLDVVVVPTNKPMIREDHADVILRTEKAKHDSVCDEIKERSERGQPVLVGTTSIENSEAISKALKRRGIKHEVLNAKNHQREADIVAQAGRHRAVTIATNMAGRGTDILLGGNPENLGRQLAFEKSGGKEWEEIDESVKAETLEQAKAICAREHDDVIEAGGLHIIGTERHESRRIDNQLRGRAGRQGDPGSSRFYLSLEDDLMKRFAGKLMEMALDQADDMPIESKMVSKAIERAQKQVEAQNFSIRKRLLEYDDVQNKQRQELYGLRREILDGDDTAEYVLERSEDIVEWLVEEAMPDDPSQGINAEELSAQVLHHFGFDPRSESISFDQSNDALTKEIYERAKSRYLEKGERIGEEMKRYERFVCLQIMDAQWKDHLLALDHLKEGIGMRAYAQRDPLVEYKKESFELFGAMKERIEAEIVRYLMLLEPMSEEERQAQEERRRREQEMIFRAASRSKAGEAAKAATTVKKSADERVGRNDPCPCGSGKKYKKCHGAAARSS